MGSLLISSLPVISILSIISATLIGVDYKYKFQNEIQLIEKLTKIQNKVQYVNSCNGNLTEQEYIEIFKEFNLVL